MAQIQVRFEYMTGLKKPFIENARLGGSWDRNGQLAEDWTFVPMKPIMFDDGCPGFVATVALDDSRIGREFKWGVSIDTVDGVTRWGIPTEQSAIDGNEQNRVFTLVQGMPTQRYYLTHCRRLGANKQVIPKRKAPAIRFAVWAPNATKVELIRGDVRTGYVYSDGHGATGSIPMTGGADGIWSVDADTDPTLRDFAAFDHTPYMFRITRDDGSVVYRTDLYSRCQIGSGGKDPANPKPGEPPWNGTTSDLDGTKSCSVVVDPERVCQEFRQLDAEGNPVWPETDWVSEDEFWQKEFSPKRPLPTRLEDLVIYELHVDGLGVGRHQRGVLEDAIGLLDYLVELGVNAVELMPFSEYEGWASWGYGTSHYMAIEYAGGGRDQFKHFVRECHRRGIAVLMDVVYNHYTHDGERAEWAYDSPAPERNIYYWYEGRPSDYRAYEDAAGNGPGQPAPGHGGYIDNQSTGYAPRYWEEVVRKMFVSSAAALVSEFHIDGFRVDQTTSIHSYAVIHADGRPADSARIFGAKFLREWTRTLQLVNPKVFLIAEDHSEWPAVTQSNMEGGLGFDAVWHSKYYHHLIGDAQNSPDKARLIKVAGYGDNRPLNMTWFAGELSATRSDKVVYHESHDEAGNSRYTVDGHEESSARTISVAVNGAPLVEGTRQYAEARTRFAAGVTLLAAGVPMFFMGEEVAVSKPYRFDDFLQNRDDFPTLRDTTGSSMFRFYQDVIRLRRSHPAFRSNSIDVLHVHDDNRVLAFRRSQENEEFIVVASLSNSPFAQGYRVENPQISDGKWREVLNSDGTRYGGDGLANQDPIQTQAGALTVRVPANGVVVLQRV